MARQIRGLTLTSLAVKSEISARMVSCYESGKTRPGQDKIQTLARVLDFPEAFFYGEAPPDIRPEAVSFRSLARTPARQRYAMTRMAGLALELDNWIDQEFERPTPAVPDLQGVAPKVAAAAVRAEWGLGVRPIGNLVQLLESKGVRVYALAELGGDLNPRNVDALSMWADDRPFIFLARSVTPERERHNAAHELAHLILHHHGAIAGREAEREADAFAGSLLVPREDLLANPPRRNLRSVIQDKRRWAVSAMALIYRMHEEELLTEWEYRNLCVRVKSSYGSSEPNEAPRESFKVLPHVLRTLSLEGSGRSEIAAALQVPVETLDLLLQFHTMLPVQGGRKEDGGNQSTVMPAENSHLTLEK